MMTDTPIKKSFAILFALLTALASVLYGCKEDVVATSKFSITEEEGAVILANAMGTRIATYGLAGQIEELAGISGGGSISSATIPNDSIAVIRARAGSFSYFYIVAFAYGIVADQFNVIYDLGGTYDTPGMSSRDTAHAELTFTNIQGQVVSVSGNYWRLGEQSSKLAEKKSYNSEIITTFTGVTIDRVTQIIQGGTLTVTLIERFPDGFVRSLPGTFTLLGNRRARLLVSNKLFSINLDTLEVTAL